MSGKILELLLKSEKTGILTNFYRKGEYADSYNDKNPTVLEIHSTAHALSGPSLAYNQRTRFIYGRPNGHFIFRTVKKDKSPYSSSAFRDSSVVRVQQEHVSDVDLKTVVDLFGEDPKAVAEALHEEAKALIALYKAKSSTEKTSIQKRFQLGEKFFYVKGGIRYESHYDIVLNTFGFTWKNFEESTLEEQASEITEEDITVKIELVYQTPSLGAENQGFKVDVVHDVYGYKTTFPHFVGLLKSKQFEDVVKEGKRFLEGHYKPATLDDLKDKDEEEKKKDVKSETPAETPVKRKRIHQKPTD